MTASIILAFIAGAFVGGAVMYFKYYKLFNKLRKDFDNLTVQYHRLEAQWEVIREIKIGVSGGNTNGQ